ncbi:MAG: hypothetical protein LH616_05495, partial [Ilumatobacteraceae bacterium]|nr:hypothetical protein [Ilumatobacteraceae bacterium]
LSNGSAKASPSHFIIPHDELRRGWDIMMNHFNTIDANSYQVLEAPDEAEIGVDRCLSSPWRNPTFHHAAVSSGFR